MIKLENLNKCYNKNKQSEYHVINDFTYEFESTGLYSIFGPSGCGKTTLLNVIGGLDSFDSGSITFENQILRRYSSKKADALRNELVGYIFQNYNLIDTMNVIENVEASLTLIGITDKEEIKKRCEECLRAVGLYKFRKRNVLALSGGQRQRVAIARALAKNPRVILADEPTGNLDSNNTFEVMNIIKSISKDRLVILVSHERNLVDFYSDRIIELKDGKIVNETINNGEKSLSHSDHRNIYLKDYKKTVINDDSADFNIYKDSNLEKPTFDIVFKNGEIYIKNNSSLKIHMIDESSEIKLLDQTEEEFKKNTVNYETSFDLSSFDETKKEKKKTAIFKNVIQGFRSTKFIKKNVFTIIVLCVVGIALAFNISSFFTVLSVSPKDYIEAPETCVKVVFTNKDTRNGLNGKTLVDSLKGDSTVEGIVGTNNDSKHYVFFDYERFYRAGYEHRFSSSMFMAIAEGKKYSIIEGSDVVKANDCVLSKWIADDILKNSNALANGYRSYSDLIGEEICLMVGASYYSYDKGNAPEYNTFFISGVSNTEDPSIFVKKESYLNASELVTAYDNAVYIATTDKSALISKIEMLGYSSVKDPSYHAALNKVIENIEDKMASFIFFGILVLSMVIYMILINRSQMFKRIKEIGTLRSIGYTKKDIVSVYLGESIALVTKTGFIAYTVAFLFIVYLSKNFNISDLGIDIFSANIGSYLMGLILLYVFNVGSTIIPVSILLHKTPVEIIKKYDI